MKKLIYCCFLLFLFGCATLPQMTAEQTRQMQIRSFSAVDYDSVFHAVRSVLQNDGYIIQNQDYNGGLIVASVTAPTENAAQDVGETMNDILSLMGAEIPPSDPTKIVSRTSKLSISLEKINANTVETRLSLDSYCQNRAGNTVRTPGSDQTLYQDFYQKLAREVERKKQQGRG